VYGVVVCWCFHFGCFGGCCQQNKAKRETPHTPIRDHPMKAADDEVISVDDSSHPQGSDATATDPLQTTTNQETQKKTKKKKSVRKSRKREIDAVI